MQERLMNVGPAFVADTQTAVAVQPGVRPLYRPARLAQPTAVRRPLLGDERLDAAPPQLLPLGLGGVGPISVQALGPLPWPQDRNTGFVCRKDVVLQ